VILLTLEVGVPEETPVDVRFQPCEAWSLGPDAAAGACAGCGWLEEDHWLADAERVERQVVATPA
jgi:hypothetical protein